MRPDFGAVAEATLIFENRIKRLEQKLGCQYPETMLVRVHLDNLVCAEFGIEILPDRAKSQIVWCLFIGVVGRPRDRFYGHTIYECLRKAEKFVEAKERRDV